MCAQKNHPAAYTMIKMFYTGGTIGMQKNDDGVLVPKPNAFKDRIKKMPQLHNEEEAKKLKRIDESDFVLVNMDGKCKFIYNIEEYFPLLDSSNISPESWVQLARDIKKYYEHYDAFIILHGTDTLAYTASALSFMLINLEKPIILTGSMIPIFEVRTDATNNMVCSLILAGCYKIPEVAIFFGNKLYRGNRTTKTSADSLSAFDSINYPPLAVMDSLESVEYDNILDGVRNSNNFFIQDTLCNDVLVLPVYPGIKGETLRAILKAPIKGVVLQCFGAGNIPTRPDVIEALREAVQEKILIVRVSMCLKGAVSDLYEVGAILGKVGVVPGYDMTTEAALGKLCCVLGNALLTFDERCEIMKTNIRGELTDV
ncbi:hypothetical protein ILUMI_24546 [Ignelater luminosus]|uniref:asparaginase n=1 Tax=Ignelater luminosus TaxID=2038154 RepID=A0A8K0C6V0_IGNLU|nr:hypothetical protein ILUMI_24546 [Ignelater luminosus]